MPNPPAPRARIMRATLAVDEPRLILERTDGTIEQLTGDAAVTRWQRLRRRKRSPDMPEAHPDQPAAPNDPG